MESTSQDQKYSEYQQYVKHCQIRGWDVPSFESYWMLPKESRDIVGSTKDANPAKSPLDIQVAGDHYKTLAIQPVEYIHANNIPFFEGSVIKYVTRWRNKGGIKDLEKAKHFIELLIELEGKRNAASNTNQTELQQTRNS